ncbi:calcineurin-binding protein [Panaeolus papilionaceus]|nr:calcineurin-binding protein [Panaeolus papilionaceus]
MESTNTIAVTSVPKSFFDPLILDMLRNHFLSFGDINQWVPLQGFARIIIVYEHDESAERAKQQSDPIVIDHEGGDEKDKIVLRVFRADPNPIIPRGQENWIPASNFLQPPAIEKNFLISPPGSPPVGWEQVVEDPPNATPLADDLMAALKKLKVYEEHSPFEKLLDPDEGSGVGVYVEDFDAGIVVEEVDDDDWVYGQTAPVRDKWRRFATAMPPIMS